MIMTGSGHAREIDMPRTPQTPNSKHKTQIETHNLKCNFRVIQDRCGAIAENMCLAKNRVVIPDIRDLVSKENQITFNLSCAEYKALTVIIFA